MNNIPSSRSSILNVLIATAAASSMLLAGCADMTQSQKGTAIGAGIGAGVGAVIGKTTGGKAGKIGRAHV